MKNLGSSLKSSEQNLKINLNQFSKIFHDRHDFETSEIKILKLKYKDIKFGRIPESWIIILDTMIGSIGQDNLSYIDQHFGFLCVGLNNSTLKSKRQIKKAENNLYSIDKDIHELLE